MLFRSPLAFGTNGEMGAECNCFLKRQAEKLSEKNEQPYRITITWIRTLLSFEILRSVYTCVRGSRTPFHKTPQGHFIDDCRLNCYPSMCNNGVSSKMSLVEMNRFLIEFFSNIYIYI